MFKKKLKNALFSGSGGAVAGLTGLKISGMEFNGSGFVLIVALSILCVTFLWALHMLAKNTDLTKVLVSWSKHEKTKGDLEEEESG